MRQIIASIKKGNKKMTYKGKNMKIKKTNQWMADMDYLHKLSKEEMEFMAKFTNEYYENHFGADPLHNKAQQTKLSYEDNVRRRCEYNILGSGNAIVKFQEMTVTAQDQAFKTNCPEDAIIDLLDNHKKEQEKV